MADAAAVAAAVPATPTTPDAPATPSAFRSRVEARGDAPVDAPDVSSQLETDAAAEVSEEFAQEPPKEGDEPEVDQFAEITGMPEADFLAALKESEGVLPDEVLEKIKMRRTRDGVEEVITLAEQRDDVLRHSDYSRKLNELRSERLEFAKAQDSFSSMVNGWRKNPGSMADDLEMLGIDLEAVLEPVARMYAAEADMTPRERDLARRAREAERRERMSRLRAKAEQDRLEADRRGSVQSRLEERIAGVRGPAFVQAKVTDGPVARRIFNEHLRAFWTGGDLTPKIAHDAAIATRQDLIRMAQEYAANGSQTPPAAPAPAASTARRPAGPPPPRGAAPGGTPGVKPAQQGGTVEDFRSYIERRREGR